MAIIGLPTPASASTRRIPFADPPFLRAPVERPPTAKLWLNIGYEINGRFAALPLGIPIDTIEPVDVQGTDTDWGIVQTAGNELLKTLQKLGTGLKPGEEFKISSLVVKLRRLNDDANARSISTNTA